MHMKIIYHWCYGKLKNYNVFISEENDYNEDNDNVEAEDPLVIIKHQKYATRLYILLFSLSLYILFFMTLINPQPRTVFVSSITPHRFDELYQKYYETLSCPCATSSIPYKNFISTTVKYHSVCESIFVSSEWINALYSEDASQYGTLDFRTTASSQFQLLSDFCSLSKSIVNQNQIDLYNQSLVSINLLSKINVETQVNVSVVFYKTSQSIRINSFLNYFLTVIRTNVLVSALNTNLLHYFDKEDSQAHSKNDLIVVTTMFLDGYDYRHKFCGVKHPIGRAQFQNLSDRSRSKDHYEWIEDSTAPKITGFYGACTPLEALLPSTLECLYNIECLYLLEHYIPAIKKMNLNWSNIVLYVSKSNLTVTSYLSNLFIDEWITKMNYSEYFHLCSPSFCTYITIDRMDLSNSMTLFISLYGGLIIILRLIAPFLINILWKIRNYFRNADDNMRWILLLRIQLYKFIHWLERLNFFKQIDQRTEDDIKRQKIMTRVYLVLLWGLLIIIVLFNRFETHTITINISNPTLNKFIELQNEYSSTLKCPCTNIAISYKNFTTISPILHQICYSSLVSDHWILGLSKVDIERDFDWRYRSFSQFALLSGLCELAKKIIDEAVSRFIGQSMIVSNMIDKNDFNEQINSTLEQFFQSISTYFSTLIEVVRLIIQVDQLYMEVPITRYPPRFPSKLIVNTIVNELNNKLSQFIIPFHGTYDIESEQINCTCATNPSCTSPAAIYINRIENYRDLSFDLAYIIPGMVTGCTITDSLLFSTLQCFYLDEECFLALIRYLRTDDSGTTIPVSFPDVNPLIYHSESTRFSRNTTINDILKKIMIEKWNSSYFYDRFYRSCTPSYCSYLKKDERKTTGEVILLMVSLISGLSLSLRFITPLLIKFIFHIKAMNTKKIVRRQQQQKQQQEHPKLLDRLKILIQKLLTLLRDLILNLNIFLRRDFDSNLDHNRAKHLGQWATRLYFVLFITILVVLTIYTIVQPQTITKTFNKLSFTLYKRHYQTYGNALECPCSLISSQYREFIIIQPEIHQVCSSSFTSEQWRINITSGLVSNLSSYKLRDYRRFLSFYQ
ncbi:hypothetical protein I4U23_011189 [Adineta vaga]|nr:hypothetical protein I4U23_011189 [Adineta vaga]